MAMLRRAELDNNKLASTILGSIEIYSPLWRLSLIDINPLVHIWSNVALPLTCLS